MPTSVRVVRTDDEKVTRLLASRLPGPLEAPRSWLGAGLLAALVAGLVAGSPSAPVAAPTTDAMHVVAVDVVPPQPIQPVFARPVRSARARPAASPPRASAPPRQADPPQSQAAPGDCSGPGWQERRGQRALASLRHAIPDGVTVAFLPGRGDLKGLTFYDTHRVEVYVGSCSAESDALLRHVVAHELGHAWDAMHLTGPLRAAYLAARGISTGTPWLGCSRCQDFATPAGDFAETYAQWQRNAPDSRSTIARPATAAELTTLGARFFAG
jgi:hypothetical protein